MSEYRESLPRLAYEAYCKTRDWKSFDGKPLPQWPDVKPDIKAGWQAAAEAVESAALAEVGIR